MPKPEQLQLPLDSNLPPCIYIAGPFRAKRNPASQWEQFQNIRMAEYVAFQVWQRGYAALCPHLNTMHFQGSLPDDVWLEGDLALLSRCDGIIMAPGWHNSTGAKAELEFARAHGIRVYYNIGELPWLRPDQNALDSFRQHQTLAPSAPNS